MKICGRPSWCIWVEHHTGMELFVAHIKQLVWKMFIGEFKLKVKVSAFKLASKQRYFVQIGSWDKKRDLNLMQRKNQDSVIESDSEEEPQVTEAEADEGSIKEQSSDVAIPDKAVVNNLPAEDFPFLCSLGVYSEFHMDALIREVVKYYGRKSIKYKQLNNRIGFLLPLPSAQTTERYIVKNWEKRMHH